MDAEAVQEPEAVQPFAQLRLQPPEAMLTGATGDQVHLVIALLFEDTEEVRAVLPADALLPAPEGISNRRVASFVIDTASAGLSGRT